MSRHLIGKLPPDAEAELQAALQIDNLKARLAAIDQANARARTKYPHLFRRNGTMKVKIEDVRIGFVNVFEPDEKFNTYGVRPILPPKHKAVKLLEEAIAEVAKEKWGAKSAQILDKLYKEDAVCLLKKDYCNKDGDPYDGYEGAYSLSCTNKTRPTVVDRDKSPLTAADGRPYGGCRSTVIVDIWAQDNGFGRRVNASLMGVQYVGDGDAFGGGRPASVDDFDDLAEGVDDEENELA